jgi:hypothetical protein
MQQRYGEFFECLRNSPGQPHPNALARSSGIFVPKTALPTGEPHADPVMNIHGPRNPFAVFDGPITIAARAVFYIK